MICWSLAWTRARKFGFLVILVGILLPALPVSATRSLPNYLDSIRTQPPIELSSRFEASSDSPGDRFRLFPWLSEPVQKAQGQVRLSDDEGNDLNLSCSKMEDPRVWWAYLDPALEAGRSYTLVVDGLEDLQGTLLISGPE